MNIKEPIFVISPYDINKFNTLEYAKINLEIYDIDRYIVFDSNYRKLSLYKEDICNKIEFKLFNTNIYKDEFAHYLKENLNKIYKEDSPKSNDINFLISLLKSEEEINKQSDSFVYNLWHQLKNKTSQLTKHVTCLGEKYSTFVLVFIVLTIFSDYLGVYALFGNQVHDRIHGTHYLSVEHSIINIALGIAAAIFIIIYSKKN